MEVPGMRMMHHGRCTAHMSMITREIRRPVALLWAVILATSPRPLRDAQRECPQGPVENATFKKKSNVKMQSRVFQFAV